MPIRTAHMFRTCLVAAIVGCGGRAADPLPIERRDAATDNDPDAHASQWDDGGGGHHDALSPTDAYASDGDGDGALRDDVVQVTATDAQAGGPLSVGALVEQWKEAGYQRGLAVCCWDFTGDALVRCAVAETFTEYLWSVAGRRCVDALANESAEVRAAIACRTENVKREAACLARTCPVQSCTYEYLPCPESPSMKALDACQFAYYCGDERRDAARCNRVIECGDRSDELGCGLPWLLCGDGVHLVHPASVCDGRADCADDGRDEMFCETFPGPRTRFGCGDGTPLIPEALCDGRSDCADGRDELFCLEPDAP